MRTLFARLPFFRACGLIVLASAALACGSAPPPKSKVGPRAPVRRALATEKPKKSSAMDMLPAHLLAELDAEHTSLYFARRGDEGLLLYVSHGRWLTRVVGPDGAPRAAQPVDVGPVSADVALGALSAAGEGYVAAWVERVNENDTVKVLALDAAGKARAAPVLVTHSADGLAWIDVLPNAKGALILWDTPRGDFADVVVVPVALDGKALAAPVRPLRDPILGWNVIATPAGAVFAVVSPASKSGKEGGDGQGDRVGRVLLIEVDAAGKARAPVVVSPEPTAHADVDVAACGGRYLLAWTDQRQADTGIYVAAIEPGGKVVTAPRRAETPFGAQALVGVVAPSSSIAGAQATGKRALLAWEAVRPVARGDRLIHIAPIDAAATMGPERATLVFSSDGGPPDLVADGEEFAAVTLAPVVEQAAEGQQACRDADCPPAGGSGAVDAPIGPTYVRFGADLNVLASEPIRADVFSADRWGAPSVTRGLSCGGGSCVVLASGSGPRPPLALVTLAVHKGQFQPPAWRDADDTPPRATALTALYEGQRLSKIVSTDVAGANGSSLVAWVTYFLEGSSSDAKARQVKGNETSATLGLRAISATGEPGPPVVLSERALSIGGVGIASAPVSAGPTGGKSKASETAIAWAARERGAPQVFVTKVGEDGKKLAQKTVTTLVRKRKGAIASEVYDVAIAYAGSAGEPARGQAGDGWIVAWVDTRDQNAEIYVAKVDRSLKKIVSDRRITSAPGDSVEVQIAVRNNDAFLVWSDARENPETGSGDIYLARLDTRTLDKRGEETRLFASALHSRSPVLAATSQGLLAAWIEENVGGTKDGGDGELGVRMAEIDDRGMLVGSPRLVRGERKRPVTSVALKCEGAACRGVLTSAVGDATLLGAFTFAPKTGASPLKTLAILSGAANADTSLSFSSGSGRSLFFADDSPARSGRVRFMTVEWP